ncbi:uncharacterized protein M421DRAFT_419993 [Didymella exigua CBS 183.55]|uniref:RCC1/BLIP-II n=1 Tax=Didymella exigua CBS 183.55 TaxID=1150837 RepID=A0A6A5RM17_9PLEO|nr:uncharacterized protein M421DRAFT_419993 [Didymella exigua CBS 183.55]KAF1929465.1 hypothetical protein M421DRAFT_419993 [Didymella exigua CBS 183.55]
MPQTLYQFGINPAKPSSKALTPKVIATSEEIKILWSSWCDLIYMTTNTSEVRTIIYSGTSLSPAQQDDFASPHSIINQALADPTCRLTFFGSTMHDGVRGYICNRRLRIFSTPAEQTGFEQDIGTWDFLASPVGEIRVCRDDSVLVSLPPCTHEIREASAHGNIATMPHLKYLGSRYATSESIHHVADIMPTQLVVNATTATALSQSGQLYTRTTDPRYPSTLGRPYTGALTFDPVPYLVELRMTKIASGGYITAAISEDGELFLWGQSNPGTDGDLGVLHRLDYNTDASVSKETAIWGDNLQGEDVKCLNIHIDGRDASAYDVAVGYGHVLVAAKDETGEQAVFTSGCGAEGQLGIGRSVEFKEEFGEVVAIRTKRVVQLAAGGWSSFIVTEDCTKM